MVPEQAISCNRWNPKKARRFVTFIVIASAAKQSQKDCFVASLLAMTRGFRRLLRGARNDGSLRENFPG